ncbi:MAG: UvrD-helicase domain-containing protein, partial [Elusimicrobiota bacterium]|nr:UvrD-helicase domain-containing protein [Elusimicrobiota bacterium]
MTDKNIPVLKKDTDLKFPHALLISASAGSGKTYTLTQRYVQLLLSTKVPLNGIENILAVTFTNNAAKEMKSRILNWFKELALDEHCPKMAETLNLVDMTSGDIHKKSQKIVERILSDYSNFHVQTIDSFFARVMGCSVAELGLPLKPNITMTYDALMDLALYSMFAKIGSKELNKKTIERFLNIMPKGNAYPWNPIIKVRDNFKDFLNEEGKTGGDIKWDDFDFDAEIKRGFSDIMKFCAKIEEKLKNADLLKTFYFAAKENGNISVFLSSYKYDYGILKGNRKKSLYDSWEKDIALLNNMVLKLSELNSKAYYHPYVLIFRKFISELDRVKNGK